MNNAEIICSQLGGGWHPVDSSTASCGVAIVSGDAANGWRARIMPSDSIRMYEASSVSSPLAALQGAYEKLKEARQQAQIEEQSLEATVKIAEAKDIASFSVIPGIASVELDVVVRGGVVAGVRVEVDAASRPLVDGIHKFIVNIPTI